MVTPISEIVFSGFVSKIINNSVDASWTKIKEVIKSKKTEHQSMESQIYSIIVNALNQITCNEYENNQDKIYQAAEELLLGYEKVKSDNIEIVRLGLKVLEKNTNNDVYIKFKGKIYDEISKKENVELYHTILLWLLDQKNKYDQLEIEQLKQKLDAVLQILRTKETESKLQYGDIRREIKSRTQKYADKWNENMFLNNFDKRDEKTGVNVKLSDVYLDELLPWYKWGNNIVASNDLRDLLSEYICEISGNKMLLILGQPGIGKSTLITWITANFTNKFDDILVYQFASDLKNPIWQDLGNDIKTALLEELNILIDDLEGKILILDGFDEISVENDRVKILNQMYWKYIKESSLNKFSLIITCRENYIHELIRINCNYITLQSWKKDQIKGFCKVFQEKTKHDISEYTIANILNNKPILGIPLILYMVLALDISIEKEGSIVDVYDRIFSLKEGGIYERCFVNIKKNKMEKYDDSHWIHVLKEQIHQISRDMSLYMFENDPDSASITQEAYMKICTNITEKSNQNAKSIEHDVLIGSYFKRVKHTEKIGVERIGVEGLSFVHRSIYEYFFIEYLCASMCQAISESKEQLAGVFGNFLKVGRLSETMCEFLKRKVKICELRDKFNIIKDTFELMLHDGMIYYTGINYRKAGKLEGVVFVNMLEILHSWEQDFLSFSSEIVWYLIHNKYESLNLNKIDLRGKNIKGAYLERAHLREADLREINLERVDLREADLRGAILNENQVKQLKGICDLHRTKVYLKDTNEIVNYEEYCSIF